MSRRGGYSCQSEPRPIFGRGAIRGIGPPRSIGALIAAVLSQQPNKEVTVIEIRSPRLPTFNHCQTDKCNPGERACAPSWRKHFQVDGQYCSCYKVSRNLKGVLSARARPRPCAGADWSRVDGGRSQHAAHVVSLGARRCRSRRCPPEAHHRLKSDIALGPESANERTRFRGRGWRRGRATTSAAVTL